MRNLTNEPEFDSVTNCNGLQHYKNQNYTTISSTSRISKKDCYFHQIMEEVLVVINLMTCLFPYLHIPHTLYVLTEYHLRSNEIDTIALTNYSLGAKFCWNTFKNGGVCIFTYESIQLTYIDFDKFC
jgi:hypothetical protein